MNSRPHHLTRNKDIVQNGSIYDANSRNAIIFNHIGKAGGTTFGTILTNCFPESNLFHVNNWLDWWRFYKFPITDEIITALITGHEVWGIQGLLENGRKIYLTTFLREPWARFKSEYVYNVKTANFPKPFNEYLKEKAPNYLLSRIANGDLELAKHRLLNEYYFFGIVEKYEESLCLFSSYFQTDPISYKIANWSLSNQFSELDKYATEFIEKNNQDIEFYKWAMELFFRRCTELFSLQENNKVHPGNVRCLGRTSTPNDSMIIEPTSNLASDANLHRQITEIEAIKLKSHWDCLSLSKLYERTREKEKAEQWLKNAISLDSGLIHELDIFYERNNSQTKHLTAMNEIFHLIKDISVKQVDSYIDICRNRIANKLATKMESGHQKCKSTVEFYKEIVNKEISGYVDPTFYLQDGTMNYHPRIGFFGASSRFKIEFQWIKKYIPDHIDLFLFDNDPTKIGLEPFGITVHNPESIKEIDPRVIFITSTFFQEIYTFLYSYRKKHNLSFSIFVLQDRNIRTDC